MPVQLNSVLRERLQNTEKKDAIELYYELLSSGPSVGEILASIDRSQCKSEHGNATTAEYLQSGPDGVASGAASETESTGVVQAGTRHIAGSILPLETVRPQTKETSITVADDLEIPLGKHEASHPDKSSNGVNRVVLGIFFTMAIASVSIASLAIVTDNRTTDPAVTPIQSGIYSGTEAVAIPGSAAGSAQTGVETPKSSRQVINPDPSRAFY